MTTRIVNARIFDGTRLLDGHSVEFRDGRITAVDTAPPGPGVSIVDGQGGTLLPGLIDAHAHVCGHPGNLGLALSFGVTTVLDMFDFPPEQVARLRTEALRPDRADYRGAGTIASATGGFPAVGAPFLPTLSEPGEAEQFVADRRREGSDYLKIILDDGRGHGLDLPPLRRETVFALVSAAREHGMPTVAHVSGAWSVRLAAEAGIDVLSHVPLDEPIEPGTAAKLAAAGQAVAPTLAVLEMCTGDRGRALVEDRRISERLPAEARAAIESGREGLPGHTGRFETALASVAELHRAGVELLAGADASQAPGRAAPVVLGAGLHRELELLVAAGLPPEAALTAATSAPARVFGLADRGRIEAGARADLLLVKGNPVADITETRSIAAVWRGGARLAPEAAEVRA